MDFDPGELYDESYEEGFDEGYEQAEEDFVEEPEVECDELGNPIYLAAAAGFGYHMAQDEMDERQLAEDILKRREGKQVKPVKVPLAHRNETKGYMTPFGRWATKANIDHKRTEDEIEYTKEEQLQIIKAQE